MNAGEVRRLRAEIEERYGTCLGDEQAWVNSLDPSPLDRVRPAVDEWLRVNDHPPTLGELRAMARRLREEQAVRPIIESTRQMLRGV